MLRFAAAVAMAAGVSLPTLAQAQDAAAVVHLLDYIAVDYAEAVADGNVKDEGVQLVVAVITVALLRHSTRKANPPKPTS